MPDRQQKLTGPADGPLYRPGDPVCGIPAFQELVLSRYRASGRKFAWRETTDPYAILVSEIMLQQTQVERVAEKYPQFLAAFPDFAALALASQSDVLAAWQGMGYNRRAIALRKCACRVVAEFEGNLPDDPSVLETFPGIGKATAASICAFAFNLPVVFIETNIRRVFIHCFFSDHDVVADTAILPLAGAALYRKNPREWYNALMDFGTELKKNLPNPNRRSRHYTKQAAFGGSDREVRGKILKLLLARGALTPASVIRELGGDGPRVRRILGALEREGFTTTDGRRITLVS